MQRRQVVTPVRRRPTKLLGWKVPAVVTALSLSTFLSTISSLTPDPAAIRIAAVVFGVAALWLVTVGAVLLHERWAAARTRGAALDARLNRIAAEIIQETGDAARAERYVLLLHEYGDAPVAEFEQALTELDGKR